MYTAHSAKRNKNSTMDFNASLQDKQKWAEFHSQEYIKTQMRMKRIIQSDLIKAIDDLSEVSVSNAKRVNLLKRLISTDITGIDVSKKSQFENTIVKYEKLTVLANKVSEIYLIILDIYTYGTNCILATDEWDWRAFARHICTILHEHLNTVNNYLNIIVQTLRSCLADTYDLTRLIRFKKDFSSFIESKSDYTKLIRINVDAHFDGDFKKRINLIKELSYYSFVELFHTYFSKMHDFLNELRPALVEMRHSVDISYHSLLKDIA